MNKNKRHYSFCYQQKLSSKGFFTRTITLVILSLCFMNEGFAFDGDGVALSADFLTGREEGEAVNGFYGSLTLPLISRFNLHLEGVVEDAEYELTGLGLHAYWQHPDYGLIGLIASDTSAEIPGDEFYPDPIDLEGTITGIEAEIYLGSAIVAAQVGSVSSNQPELDDENYSAAEIYLPASTNLYLFGGTRKLADERSNNIEAGYTFSSTFTLYGGSSWDAFENSYLGFEYLMVSHSKSRLAFSVEVDKGEDDFNAIYLGLHYLFGASEKAPLITLFSPVSGGLR